jgi:hypothetical protein
MNVQHVDVPILSRLSWVEFFIKRDKRNDALSSAYCTSPSRTVRFRHFYEHPFRSAAVFKCLDLSSSHVNILLAEVSAADAARGLPLHHLRFVASFLYGGIRRSMRSHYLMEDETSH